MFKLSVSCLVFMWLFCWCVCINLLNFLLLIWFVIEVEYVLIWLGLILFIICCYGRFVEWIVLVVVKIVVCKFFGW